MRATAHLRKKLVAGLLVVLPLVVTLWVLSLLLDLVDATLAPLRGLERLFPDVHPELLWWLARAVGVVVILVAVYLVGLLAAGVMGRRVVGATERWIRRVPVVGAVYGASRQLLDAVSRGGADAFTRCALLEYPRRGVHTLVFVTREEPHSLPDHQTGFLSVFIPTTPNPTSGFFLLVPRDDLIELDLAVDEGIKLIMSAGLLAPDDLGRRLTTSKGTKGDPRSLPEERPWTPS